MAKLPGVGYRLAPRTQVCTENSDSSNRSCADLDLSARPFGPTGNGPLDRAELGRRYAGGPGNYPSSRQPIGLWADMEQINVEVLRRWFQDQPASHREKWTGEPTLEEWYDLCHSHSRIGDPFYAEYWFSQIDGGSPETALPITAGNWNRYSWQFDLPPRHPQHLDRRLGLQSYLSSLRYPVFVDIQWLPGEVEPPVPPPPPEPPPPEPEPGPWPPVGPYLSEVSQRAKELSIHVDRIVNVGPRWLRLLRNEARETTFIEGDLIVKALRLAVRIKRRLLGETEGWGRPS